MKFKIYTGGYYDAATGEYGSGAVILNEANVSVATISEKEVDFTKFRNVAEIKAVEKALRYLYKHYQPKAKKENKRLYAKVFHSADGIMKWGNGEWTANKELTINYQACIKNARNVMDIEFEKANAKGVFTVLARQLAEQAVVPAEDNPDGTHVVEKPFAVPASDNSAVANDANGDKIVVRLVLDKEQLDNEFETRDAFIECVTSNLPVIEVKFE